MSYQTQRQKVIEYLDNKILPSLRENHWKELDYAKTIALISSELGTVEATIEDVIKSMIKAGKLAENRTLTLPKAEVEEIIKKKMEIISREFKEAGLS